MGCNYFIFTPWLAKNYAIMSMMTKLGLAEQSIFLMPDSTRSEVKLYRAILEQAIKDACMKVPSKPKEVPAAALKNQSKGPEYKAAKRSMSHAATRAYDAYREALLAIDDARRFLERPDRVRDMAVAAGLDANKLINALSRVKGAGWVLPSRLSEILAEEVRAEFAVAQAMVAPGVASELK